MRGTHPCCAVVWFFVFIVREGGRKKEVGSVNAFTGQYERINSMTMARLSPANKNNIGRSRRRKTKWSGDTTPAHTTGRQGSSAVQYCTLLYCAVLCCEQFAGAGCREERRKQINYLRERKSYLFNERLKKLKESKKVTSVLCRDLIITMKKRTGSPKPMCWKKEANEGEKEERW